MLTLGTEVCRNYTKHSSYRNGQETNLISHSIRAILKLSFLKKCLIVSNGSKPKGTPWSHGLHRSFIFQFPFWQLTVNAMLKCKPVYDTNEFYGSWKSLKRSRAVVKVHNMSKTEAVKAIYAMTKGAVMSKTKTGIMVQYLISFLMNIFLKYCNSCIIW